MKHENREVVAGWAILLVVQATLVALNEASRNVTGQAFGWLVVMAPLLFAVVYVVGYAIVYALRGGDEHEGNQREGQ